ncbi:MAG: UDP-2,3-diacylglucosamine diphosphatase LpxI [Synergistaceae bacterium]|nr:UDP-2,3-diacylglucosamine diphosphatase LpxI [Synergistaceae bacterium]
MDNKIALIAGDGNLPVVIASRLTDMGTPPVVYSVREKVGEISKYALEVVNIVKPDLGSTIKDMNDRGVKRIIMAGLISKTLAFKPLLFDLTTQRFLASLVFRDDHSLLGALVDFLEKSGFEVMSYREIIPDLLAISGHIAGRKPTSEEMADVEYGFSICKALVPLSFGQTVVVNKRSVVAVEAMEGTDATLLRAGSLCSGGTVVKMMRLDQDQRYDIPTVGPNTLRNMAQAKLTCLAIHAGWTLVMEPEEFRSVAEKEKITVIGIEQCRSS